MEEEVLREMRSIVGWPDGEGDGIFCPGGSIANGYAISCARFYFYPEIKVSVFNISYYCSFSIKNTLFNFGSKKAFLKVNNTIFAENIPNIENRL